MIQYIVRKVIKAELVDLHLGLFSPLGLLVVGWIMFTTRQEAAMLNTHWLTGKVLRSAYILSVRLWRHVPFRITLKWSMKSNSVLWFLNFYPFLFKIFLMNPLKVDSEIMNWSANSQTGLACSQDTDVADLHNITHTNTHICVIVQHVAHSNPNNSLFITILP